MKNKIIIAILIVLFIILGVLCLNNYTQIIDDFVYNVVIKIKCNPITNVMKFISFIFSTIMVIIYCVLGLIILKNKRHSVFLCSIMASEALINNLVKIIFKRSRPSVLALVVEKTYSFPSGHTMAATILILVVGYLIKQKYQSKKKLINILQIVLILLVALSRIYLGVHYFTDIIGAIILSTIILLIIKDSQKLNKWLKEGNV